jgi:predicted Zn-dependent protease
LSAAVDLAVRRGHVDQALIRANAIKARHPEQALGSLLEGQIRMAQARPEEAARLFAEAYALEPGLEPLLREARAWAKAGRNDQARTRLADWLDEHPNEIAALVLNADLAVRQGESAQAIAAYERALALEPDKASALNNLAWLYNERDDPRALALAERAQRLAPDAPLMAETLGWVLVSQGKVERGLDLLKKVFTALPEESTLRYHLAVAYQKSNHPELARLYLRPALEGARDFPEAEKARALYAQVGGELH